MRALVASLILAGLEGGAPPEKPRGPSFVPGEVIVRFKKGSEPGEIAAALAGGDAAAQARLDGYVAGLSRALGVPIRAQRMASGGDVLLAVDLQELSARLASHLKVHPRVARAAPSAAEVEVQFRQGSREAEEIARAPVEKAEAPALPEITKGLARGFGFALRSRITAKRELLVSVDASALTSSLVERLGRLPEVDYAQPNFIVRGLGPSPPRRQRRRRALRGPAPAGPQRSCRGSMTRAPGVGPFAHQGASAFRGEMASRHCDIGGGLLDGQRP